MAKRFLSLSVILDSFCQQSGLQKEMVLYRLATHWEEVVGPQIAMHTAPEVIRFQVLTLGVDSAPWMNQLFYFKKEILAKANRFLKTSPLQDIYFKRVTLPVRSPAKDLPPAPTNPKDTTPLSTDLSLLYERLDGVHDAEIKQTIREALGRYYGAPHDKNPLQNAGLRRGAK